MLKRTLFGLFAWALAATAALAQVNVVPQVGVTSGYVYKQTFSAAFFGLVPVSGGTDVVCIAGSASKLVRVQQVVISGTTATAPQTVPVQLLRRVAADTGGTPASTTANPANTVAKLDTGNGAPTATLISYTANPTVNDASPTYLESWLMTMPVVTGVMTPLSVNYQFDYTIASLNQPPTLRGIAQQICVSLGGATLTNASAWNGHITWTEE